jgi:8-oxo-dGTP pyrophosphatase MutT (NUDIX family)
VTSAELRARLARIGAQTRSEPTQPPGVAEPTVVPAAVLVPIIIHDAPTILLTKRNSHLKQHAGQVSFPGGRIDPDDPSPEAAALREAWEEIGLPPSAVEVLGRLDDQVTGTGFRITPILAVLPPALTYELSPYEVEAIFELPMSVVLDPAAPRRQNHEGSTGWREYWVWPHDDHFIWGATAAILVQLAQRLRKDMGDA